MTKYICDKCGGVSYSSSSQAPCPYCKEVEKMIKTYAEADNERRMLDGNLNRMHLTKDLTELESMHDWAVKRVDRLYLFYAEELRRRLAIDEKEVKAVCSECSWKSRDACSVCDLRDERKFKEGQLVVYKNGSRYEIGKIKRVVEDGAFVYYHEGETAAKTPFDCMFPIENEHCIKQTSLGGE